MGYIARTSRQMGQYIEGWGDQYPRPHRSSLPRTAGSSVTPGRPVYSFWQFKPCPIQPDGRYAGVVSGYSMGDSPPNRMRVAPDGGIVSTGPMSEKQVSQQTTGGHRARLHRFWYAVAAAVGLIVLLRVAEPRWRWSPPSDSSAITRSSDLAKLPEAQLFYPGSTLLGSGGTDYESGIWGSNPAVWGNRLGTDASKDDVFAFYDRELVARGWQASGGTAVGTAEVEGRGWQKGRVEIQVVILRKSDPQNPTAINAYQSPYRITLIAPRP